MSYELFISSHSVSSEPFISLVKEGFRFSAAFVQKYHLERASGVRLYFNRPKHAIGFYFATAANAEDGTLKPKRHAGGLVVRAKGLTRRCTRDDINRGRSKMARSSGYS